MTDIPKSNNGNYSWIEYRRLVLSELGDLKSSVVKIEGEQVKIKLDIRGLQTKATIWGGISGLLVGGAITLIGWIFF